MTDTTVEALPQAASPRWGRVILVAAAVALYWSSLYFYVPTLPVYIETKTDDLAAVGVVLSMYGLWQALVRLPVGIAADWLGRRKPFLIAGFLLCALGAWIMASASGVPGLVLGRAITGLAAATWVPLVVMFSSLFPPHEAVRATAALSLVNAISRMIATYATGTLNEMGGYSLAFMVSIGAAALAILVIVPVREQARPPRRPSPRAIGVLVTRRDVLLPALLSLVAQYVSWASTFGFLPVLAKNLGATDQLQGWLMSMNLFIGMLGNLITTAVARRTGTLRLIYLSFALTCGGVILAGAGNDLAFVWAGQALIGLGGGIGGPLLMGLSIEKVVESERATAMGLHQAVYAIGMFAGPWLSGMLADSIGIQPMFIATGIVTLLIGVAGSQWLKEKR